MGECRRMLSRETLGRGRVGCSPRPHKVRARIARGPKEGALVEMGKREAHACTDFRLGRPPLKSSRGCNGPGACVP